MNKGRLYTSYTANWRNWKDLDVVKICIMRFPNFDLERYQALHFKGLAPSIELMNDYKAGKINEQVFETIYIEQLLTDKESIEDAYKVKRLLNEGIDVLLICCEGKHKFCHRNILRKIYESIGFECKEL